MAGNVKVDCYHLPGVSVVDLVARTCPVSQAYGEICQRYDPHTGAVDWCPFMYGLVVRTAGLHCGEARTPKGAASWMAAAEGFEQGSYTVRCLRALSADMIPGATRQW